MPFLLIRRLVKPPALIRSNTESIFVILGEGCVGTINIHIILNFQVSISYEICLMSIWVDFHTFKNVTITSLLHVMYEYSFKT